MLKRYDQRWNRQRVFLMNGGRPIPVQTYLFFFFIFGSVLFLIHTPLLQLPYFWDELGQFIPAALDLFHDHAWIPHSAVPNAHPPGLMAYLAVCWSVGGYSIFTTRVAMLLAASGGMLVVFLLAIRLSSSLRGAPAFVVVMLLALSPLFYAQSVLALLDLPAMLFTCLALLLFLQDRMVVSAAACTALVLVRETGVFVPVVLAAWLIFERRYRDAACFVAPLCALAAWFLALKHATGHFLGNPEFARYNLLYLLHPVRFAVALLRRLYFLFVADFHWIGSLAIIVAWRHTAVFRTRDWKVAASLVAACVLLFSLAGGALLERYLLPALPIVYAAMVAGFSTLARRSRLLAQYGMAAGLVAANLVNPPYPFPLDNNTAFADSVRLQKAAAEFLEFNYPDRRIVTAWPMAAALSRSAYGYVHHGLNVQALPDLRAETLEKIDWSKAEVLVLYSRNWEPDWNLLQVEPFRWFWARYFDYRADVAAPAAETSVMWEHVGHWSRSGQWVDVYAANRSRERRRYLVQKGSPAGMN